MSSRGGTNKGSEEERQRAREARRDYQREYARRTRATEAGKARQQRYTQSEKGKAAAQRHNASESAKAALARYRKGATWQGAPDTVHPTGHVVHTRALRTALNTAERTGATQRTPMAHIFAPDGSQPLPARRALGSSGHVPFTPAEYAKLPGTIVTFSHPTPGSFTLGEVHFAAEHGLAELRAADSRNRYALTPPVGGWNPGSYASTIRPAWEAAQTAIRAQLERAVNTGRITHTLGMQEFDHHVWRKVAKATGMGYSQIAWHQKLGE